MAFKIWILAFCLLMACQTPAQSARWYKHTVSVWVQPDSLPDALPTDSMYVIDAFRAWQTHTSPHFKFVRDSTIADIIVVWTDNFLSRPITGLTSTRIYQTWLFRNEITYAEIILATNRANEHQLTAYDRYKIALHEVGHSIGLSHSADSTDIMFPIVYVDKLSPRDRAARDSLYPRR